MYMRFVSVVFTLIIHMVSVAMPSPREHGQICVKSIDRLSCCYRDEGTTGKEGYAECSLNKEIYYKMAYMCTAVKILNGYLRDTGKVSKVCDVESSSSYTLSKSNSNSRWGAARNVLIPYISVIQKKDKGLEYLLHQPSQKDPLDVFISGNTGCSSEELSETYNYFLHDNMFSLGRIEIHACPKEHTEPKLLKHLEKVKFLTFEGVTVDIFSWNDTCDICASKIHKFLHSSQVPVLFRIVSQRPGENSILPIDLSNEYDGAPLSFQDLYKQREFLVTRIDPNIDRIRDFVIENLHTGIITLALQKDVSFWRNVQPFIMKLALEKTSQARNVLRIFELRFPMDATLIKAYDYLKDDEPKIKVGVLKKFYENLTRLSRETSMLSPEAAEGRIFLRACNRIGTGLSEKTNLSAVGEWVKVLRGRAILFLTDYDSHLDELCSECLLYSLQKEGNISILEYINNYEKEFQLKSVGWNFNGPDEIERKNISRLKELLEQQKKVTERVESVSSGSEE